MEARYKVPCLLNDDSLEEEVEFVESNHASICFPHFEAIRRQGKLCDVTLVVGDTRFSSHRVVLAATIPYFHAMFTSDMIESNQREINMQGIEPEVLGQLINFAYSGTVKITNHNVQNLFVGASFLQLANICTSCSKFLMRRLHASNVLNIRQFAQALGAVSLVEAADKFLQKHFVHVRLSEEFFQLSFEDLVDIISRDELNVNSEEQVFDAALTWVQRDAVYRSGHLPEILAHVRLPLLKPQYLTDKVASEELIKRNLRCRDLVDEAKDYHLMPERRPLMQTFRTRARVCNDIPGIIYAVGGLTNSNESMSTVEIYDPASAKWASIAPMSTLRSRVGVAVHNGLLYAIGGFNGHERLRTVEVYNPETRFWKEIAPLQCKRSALGSTVVGNLLYVCGGYDGISSLASVECYDIDSADKWQSAPQMNKQRSAAGISVLGGKIYVLGGHDGMSIFSNAECFDPQSGAWVPVKPMLNRRCRLGAAALNGKVYACGGYDGAQFLRSVECYDPKTDKWTLIAPMNVKRSRVALVSNCDRLYAIGGYDGISNLSSMEMYIPEEDKWVFGCSMVAHEGGVGIGVVPQNDFGD